jgi:NADP-dependent 3-hydroxy acid dehydrogenase YdfG
MTVQLSGTVALVTGASSGIGEATARELAARGAAVALVARRLDRLEAVAAKIEARGGTAVAIETDVADVHQVRDAVETTVRTFGRLDILINNAGVTRHGSLLDGAVEDWARLVQVNLLGTLYCAHAALPHLVRAAADGPRQVADLINVSSLSARVIRPDAAVYSATKLAVNTVSEALRQEVAGRRVRVSVLEPSAVETDLFPPEYWAQRRAERGFPGLSPEDVADAIGYAVSRPAHVAVSDLLVRPSAQR